MPVTRLNHAVLWVGDAQRSSAFYQEALRFRPVAEMPGAVFLQAEGSTNDHDLAVMSSGRPGHPAPAGSIGLYHLAWEVDTLGELASTARRLADMGALAGASDHSTTKSLYAKDPDGIEFEVAWVVPAALLDDAARDGRSRIRPLDLDAAIERYGIDTPGGIGISWPAPADA